MTSISRKLPHAICDLITCYGNRMLYVNLIACIENIYIYIFPEDNLLQLSRIQQRIQEMRVQNAQNTLDVNNSGDGQSKDNRLSNSCPSLNNSSDMIILEQLGQIDPTTGTPNAGQQSHYNHSSSSSSRRRKNNMETTPGNRTSRLEIGIFC